MTSPKTMELPVLRINLTHEKSGLIANEGSRNECLQWLNMAYGWWCLSVKGIIHKYSLAWQADFHDLSFPLSIHTKKCHADYQEFSVYFWLVSHLLSTPIPVTRVWYSLRTTPNEKKKNKLAECPIELKRSAETRAVAPSVARASRRSLSKR